MIQMKSAHLSKAIVAMLFLVVAVMFFSGRVGEAAAYSYSPHGCYYYGYYNITYWYWYWYYGYPYYYYYGSPYYCYYYYGYYGYYYYTPTSKYQLTVTTDPPEISEVTGTGTYTQGTTATFSVTRNVVQVAPNIRYVFSHWTGDYSGVGTTGTITINGAKKVTAVYQLQHKLDVGVAPQSAPLPQGEGWYNAGDTVTLTVAGQILGGADGSRLVFEGWNVDGRETRTTASLSLKMDAPHAVTARYKLQYYLRVLSDRGVPYGEGWYDAGSTAQIFVTTPASTEFGVSIVFKGWQGDILTSSQSATVLMDSAKTAIATWGTDPTILNLTIALALIAILMAGTGVLAYVALGRRGYRHQTLKPYIQKAAPVAAPQPPLKRKIPPLRKATQPPEETIEPPKD